MTTALKLAHTVDFAITLTLSPHLYGLSTAVQAQKALACFNFCINSNKTIQCSAFLEETRDYNIHIHAILKCKLTDYISRYGARRYLMNLFRNKNWGKIKDINPVTNYESWTKYIIKDVNLEREYYPVIRDDYGLLNGQLVA